MGDFGAFQDDDGNASLMHTFDRGGPNKAQAIVKFDSTSLRRVLPASEGGYIAEFFGDVRETAGIIKKDSLDYYFTSDCLGWTTSMTKYQAILSMDGKWSNAYPVLTYPEESRSFRTQHDFVLPIIGTEETTYIYCGDRWSVCGSQDYENKIGLYAWFTLEFDENGVPVRETPNFLQTVETGIYMQLAENGGHIRLLISHLNYSEKFNNETI